MPPLATERQACWRSICTGTLALVACAALGAAASFLDRSQTSHRAPPANSIRGLSNRLHLRAGTHGGDPGLSASVAANEARGLAELFGDRTSLSLNAVPPPNSASWTPASPWYEAQNMSAHFPACSAPDPADCDDWYAHQTIADVQAALWETQNPADCSSARYLVLDKSWRSGLGSTLHIHIYMLALAISANRILVPADDIDWFYASSQLCRQAALFESHTMGLSTTQDQSEAAVPSRHMHRRHANRKQRVDTVGAKKYMDCYFLPTTNCPLPADWRARAKNMTAMNSTDQIVRLPAKYGFSFTNMRGRNPRAVSDHPVLAAHKDKPVIWWQAQLAKFVLRPSDYTLRHLVWPLQHSAFYGTQGALPHPLAAVFIRAGDKYRDGSKLMSVDSHFAEMAPVADQLGIKDVYVGSDSHDCIAEAADKYGDKYNIHFIDWARPHAGIAFGDVVKSQHSWRMAELVRLALADLFITAQADVVVGTLSSNWAQLGNELRRANGKARVPHLNPEKPRHVGEGNKAS